MEYRKLPHGGEKISVIGLGMGSVTGTEEEIVCLLNTAIENGVNFFDLAASEEAPYHAYAKAFEGRREQLITQMHFGAVYDNGKYGWSRDLKRIKEQFEWELSLFHTDYTDLGYIHCVDEPDDLKEIMEGGIWDYMKGLKSEGKIRHLGFSSHNPEIARRLLETGLIDMFMFSINPAYDYQKGKYAIGEAKERADLYRDCEKLGVGISVMKPFAGGQLLNEKTSLFHRALTETQCIQYALDRPAVLTVLPGVRDVKDGAPVPQGLGGGKGLFGDRRIYAAECRRDLRLLQPLPAVPEGAQRGLNQQVLRSGPGRRRDGKGTLRKAVRKGR